MPTENTPKDPSFDDAGLGNWVEDLDALSSLIRDTQDRLGRKNLTVVEVGSYAGRTAILMADLGCTVYCIDLWHMSDRGFVPPGGWIKSLYQVFMDNVGDRMFKNVFPCVGPSVHYAERWRLPLDLVYIDGDHSYEGVRTDIRSWGSRIAPGGVLAGHDINCPDTKRAVDEVGSYKRNVNPDPEFGGVWWKVMVEDPVLVSVIIPCFNYGRFLQDAIDSLLAQTHGNWEAIIIDDTSTDDSFDVAQKIAETDSRITAFEINHGGVSAARNAGLGKVRGEFVMFLDADDVLDPRALSTLLFALEQNSSYQAVAGYRTQSNIGQERLLTPVDYDPSRREFTFKMLTNGNIVGTPGQVLIRREHAEPFTVELSASEDWDMWLRLSAKHPILMCQQVVLDRRMHGDNTSSSQSLMDAGADAVRQRIPSLRPKAVLVQQASGWHRDLLAETRILHTDYCKRMGIDYRRLITKRLCDRDIAWDKIVVLRETLALPYDVVIWLDADTVIVSDEDLRDALPANKDFGMIRLGNVSYKDLGFHYNAGALYIRNTERMRKFFDDVWDDHEEDMKEQGSIHNVLMREGFPEWFVQIDDKWNSTMGGNESPSPVVVAWHGTTGVEENTRHIRETVCEHIKKTPLLMTAVMPRFRFVIRSKFFAIHDSNVLIYYPEGVGDFVFLSYVLPLMDRSNQYWLTRGGAASPSLFEGSNFVTPVYSGAGPGDEDRFGDWHEGNWHEGSIEGGVDKLTLPPSVMQYCVEHDIDTILPLRLSETWGGDHFPFHSKFRHDIPCLVSREAISKIRLDSPLEAGIPWTPTQWLTEWVRARIRRMSSGNDTRLCLISRNGYTATQKNWGHLFREEMPDGKQREGEECRDFMRAMLEEDPDWLFLVMEDRMFEGDDTVRDVALNCYSYAEVFGSNFGTMLPFALVCRDLVCMAELSVGVPTGPYHLSTAHPTLPTIGLWIDHHPSWYDEPNKNGVHILSQHLWESGAINRPGTFTDRGNLHYRCIRSPKRIIPGELVAEVAQDLVGKRPIKVIEEVPAPQIQVPQPGRIAF